MTEQERMILRSALHWHLRQHFQCVEIEHPASIITGTKRRWRCDFYATDFKHRRLVVEVNGGNFTNGRHTRGASYAADLEKINHLTASGCAVFQFTYNCLKERKYESLIQTYLQNTSQP